MTKTPLYKDLSDSALIEEYKGLKVLAYHGAQLKSKNLGQLLKSLDIVIAIARKRGLQLPV